MANNPQLPGVNKYDIAGAIVTAAVGIISAVGMIASIICQTKGNEMRLPPRSK